MPPKPTTAAVATTNRNLNSTVASAMQRVKEDQRFKLAIEQLVQMDCATEHETSVWNLGYCSDVVSLGVLDKARIAQQQLQDEEQEKQQEEQDQEASTAKQSSYSRGARRRQRVEKSSDDDDANNDGGASRSIWNPKALDRPMPELADWSFLQTATNTRKAAGAAVSAGPSTTAGNNSSSLALLSASSPHLDGDEHFQWFRNRSAKLDRTRERWNRAAENASAGGGGEKEPPVEEVARRVML